MEQRVGPVTLRRGPIYARELLDVSFGLGELTAAVERVSVCVAVNNPLPLKQTFPCYLFEIPDCLIKLNQSSVGEAKQDSIGVRIEVFLCNWLQERNHQCPIRISPRI